MDIKAEDFFTTFVARSQENKKCFDCKEPNPKWASISHGCLICTNCTSLHRALGSSVSIVRSIELDIWTDKQLALMEKGGNIEL